MKKTLKKIARGVSPTYKMLANNDKKLNLILKKVDELDRLRDLLEESRHKVSNIEKIVQSDSYKKIESVLAKFKENNLGSSIGEDGERLVPGYSNDIEEFVRHRSTYSFFKKIIEKDIVNDPRIIKDKLRILDLGCGVGHGSSLLSGIINSEVVGVDIESRAINFARENYASDNATYVNESIEKYLSYNKQFDYIVSRHALEHIETSPSEVLKKLRFTHRVMLSIPYKEGGDNKYHLQKMIDERSFLKIKNKEFFYEDLDGITAPEPFRARKTNSFTCIVSRPGIKNVSKILRFPIPQVKLKGLERDFVEIFNK